MSKLLFGDGDYGFLNNKDLSKGNFTEKIISCDKVNWAVTKDFSDIAKNHCGAVCALNIVLFFAQKATELLTEGDIRKTFVALHDLIGNGPTPSIASNTSKYFSQMGYTLRYRSNIKSIEELKAAIDRNNPCGILLANALADWHWVLGAGYRVYEGGDGYIIIQDGWNRGVLRYYKPNSGSAWVSATEYFLD